VVARYLDVNGLSKAAQSGDQKMDYQLYHTYIDVRLTSVFNFIQLYPIPDLSSSFSG